MYILPITLVFSTSLGLLVSAGSQTHGQNCTVLNNRLETGTLQFYSDCDAQSYCSGQGVCERKGCRKDQYPFGYVQEDDLPPKCPAGQFCPDEADACQPLLPVGSTCQLNRDDQCEPPPNWVELADNTQYGVNVNGSICLNNVCTWANVTVGQACQVENTAYIVYAGTNEYIDIISRGNCQTGLYCDAQQLVCRQSKRLGETCDADKECASFNCDNSGVCIRAADVPNEFGVWVYVLAGVGISGGMFGTLFALSWIHRRQRETERERRLQYWREQHALRENIRQMQETTHMSIMSLTGGNSRDTIHSYADSDESSRPMLLQQPTVTKSSGLRYYTAEDGVVANEEM